MINLNTIRLQFRNWMDSSGIDTTALLVCENRPEDIDDQSVYIEEMFESISQTTNTSTTSVLRGMATYYVDAYKGIGTASQASIVQKLGEILEPAARKDQTIGVIRINVEDVNEGIGSDFQSERAKRWRIPFRVVFRAYQDNP